VIMNPPFSGGRDIAHVRHAIQFLAPGGRLAAIMSRQWQEKDTKDATAFRTLLASLGATVQPIAAGAFKAVGTDVPTCMVTLQLPSVASVSKASPPVQRVHAEQVALF
jgi:hypothetical protein